MTENGNLKGKIAIVTGATSGIGLAIARELARAGAKVYVAGRSAERTDAAAAKLKAEGLDAASSVFNMREPAEVIAAIEKIAEDEGALNIMVNNAGLSYPGSILDGDPEHWREMYETNCVGLLAGCKGAVGAMRKTKSAGHVVNISSIAGRSETAGVYGSTKSAVNQICSTLRKELENDPIRVVNIMPGAVVTNFGRNFPPEMVKGLLAAGGVGQDFEAGDTLGEEDLAKVQTAQKQAFASAEDVARAVRYVVEQPTELNISEMVVRPQIALQF